MPGTPGIPCKHPATPSTAKRCSHTPLHAKDDPKLMFLLVKLEMKKKILNVPSSIPQCKRICNITIHPPFYWYCSQHVPVGNKSGKMAIFTRKTTSTIGDVAELETTCTTFRNGPCTSIYYNILQYLCKYIHITYDSYDIYTRVNYIKQWYNIHKNTDFDFDRHPDQLLCHIYMVDTTTIRDLCFCCTGSGVSRIQIRNLIEISAYLPRDRVSSRAIFWMKCLSHTDGSQPQRLKL